MADFVHRRIFMLPAAPYPVVDYWAFTGIAMSAQVFSYVDNRAQLDHGYRLHRTVGFVNVPVILRRQIAVAKLGADTDKPTAGLVKYPVAEITALYLVQMVVLAL